MEPSSSTGDAAMSSLLAEMDQVIAGIAKLDRRSAYAALETVFGGLKASCETLSEAETSEYIELVHLVLLQFARGETIRVSGPNQVHELDVCLKYNDVYEAALYHAMEFLARNLFDHLEKYSPHQYLHAALRVLGKEYYRALKDSYHTDTIPEESAPSSEYEPSPADARADEALTVAGPEQKNPPACVSEDGAELKTDQQMFYNWYEGNLSRFELTRLYGLTIDVVDQTLLRVARTYDGGRHYGMVKWLVELGEDGDIIWLLSKDMTAADVGQKVSRNKWVVYKHRDAVLRRFQALRLTGDDGRALCAKLFGLDGAPESGQNMPHATRDRALRVSLPALGIEAQVPTG
jgi:hypothetical protein